MPVVGEGGRDHDAALGPGAVRGPDHFDTRAIGQPQIDNQDIGRRTGEQRHRLGDVLGCRMQHHILGRLDRGNEAAAERRIVLDDRHLEGHRPCRHEFPPARPGALI